MSKKFFMIPAILLAVAAGVVASAAVQGKHLRHSGWMLQRMTKELNLTQAQQTQIKGILQTQKAKIRPLMQQLRQNSQAENANITSNFDEAKARAFADQQAKIMSDLTVEKERTKSEIYAVLTPEQRQKALALSQERQQHRRHRRNDVPQQAQQP